MRQIVVFRRLYHTGGRCAEVECVHGRADEHRAVARPRMLAFARDDARTRDRYRVSGGNVRLDALHFYRSHGDDQDYEGLLESLVQ